MNHATMRAILAASSLLTLSACATSALVHPPGRNMATYDACLVNISFPGRSTSVSSRSQALSELAAAIARGDALTTDQFALNPSPLGATEYLGKVEKTPFQQFLDCYAGPVEPLDFESRLIRGHIVLAMIANYAAQTVQASGTRKEQYAASALGMVAAAELDLRATSWEEFQYAQGHQKAMAGASASAGYGGPPYAAPPVTYADLPLRHIANVHRITELVTLAAFTDGIATRNILGIALTAAGEAASTVSPISAAEKIAGQALNALEAAIRTNDTKAAEFGASYETLRNLKQHVPEPAKKDPGDTTVANIEKANFGPPDRLHQAWATWDQYLSDACTSLAASAAKSTSTSTCLPTDDQIIQATPWAKLVPSAPAEAAK